MYPYFKLFSIKPVILKHVNVYQNNKWELEIIALIVEVINNERRDYYQLCSQVIHFENQ